MESEKQEGKISRELHCDQNFLPAISMNRIRQVGLSCGPRIFLYSIFLLAESEQEDAVQEYTESTKSEQARLVQYRARLLRGRPISQPLAYARGTVPVSRCCLA
jgi:hypothetical protein